MPFLTFEHSANLQPLDVPVLLRRLNQAIVDAGQAEEVLIKSRARVFDTYQVGTTDAPRAFAHVKLSLLSGRSDEVKGDLADRLMAVLRESVPEVGLVQLAVELSDIERPGFRSARVGA